MTAHLTEEEQLEMFKRWWKENGRSLVIGVVIAALAFVGWRLWQQQHQQRLVEDAVRYQGLLDAVAGMSDTEDRATQLVTIIHLGQQIKEHHASRLTASMAALQVASVAVTENNLEAARAELRWVFDKAKDPAVVDLARYRLARVLMAQNNTEPALNLLQQGLDAQTSLLSLYEEAQGDAYFVRGDYRAARSAYELALAKIAPDQQARRAFLNAKVYDTYRPGSYDAAPEIAVAETQEVTP